MGHRVARPGLQRPHRGRVGRQEKEGPVFGDLYERALAGERCFTRDADGLRVELPVERWLGNCIGDRPFDDAVLAMCDGPTIELGCGPGRLIARLSQDGIPALGVDRSPRAVHIAREPGCSGAVRRCVRRSSGRRAVAHSAADRWQCRSWCRPRAHLAAVAGFASRWRVLRGGTRRTTLGHDVESGPVGDRQRGRTVVPLVEGGHRLRRGFGRVGGDAAQGDAGARRPSTGDHGTHLVWSSGAIQRRSMS
jgi:SAM-dependent methyltransferase